jgi:hypothetical protein
VAAFLFYKFIKILEYEMANPGQDLSLAEAKAAGLHDNKERGEEV